MVLELTSPLVTLRNLSPTNLPSPTTSPDKSNPERCSVAKMLKLYWEIIKEENVPAHQEGKLSMPRAFFGSAADWRGHRSRMPLQSEALLYRDIP